MNHATCEVISKPEPNNNYKLMNDDDYIRTSSMKRQSHNNDDYGSIVSAEDAEVAVNKQKQLSDWYYIKTSPKQKPSSPYERRKAKNFLHHPPAKLAQPLPPTEPFDIRNSSDKINGFIPIQKYRSNDFIMPHEQQQSFLEEKSPLQSYKCFSMKYSRHPSGRSETKFGEMTSSSFEHVNVTGLHENRFSETDLRNDDYVQSLRIAAARMRPLPQAPLAIKNLESQVC